MIIRFRGENIPCDSPKEDSETEEVSMSPQLNNQDQIDVEAHSPSLLDENCEDHSVGCKGPNENLEQVKCNSSNSSSVSPKSCERNPLDEKNNANANVRLNETASTSLPSLRETYKSSKEDSNWVKPLEYPARSGYVQH